MVVTLKIATDLYGAKVNYLIDFQTIPSVHELKVKTEAVFTRESDVRRPAGAPPELFKIDHIQLFDLPTRGWIELGSSGSKITDGCQLYVFQPPNHWHNDTQGGLPPAIRPPVSIHPNTIIERFSPPPCAAASPETAMGRLSSVSPRRQLPVTPPIAVPIAPPVTLPIAPPMTHAISPPASLAIAPPTHESVTRAGLALGDMVTTTQIAHAAVVETEHEIAVHNQHLSMQEMKAHESTKIADGAAATLSEARFSATQAKEAFGAAASSVEAVKAREREVAAEHLRLVEQMTIVEGRSHAQSTETARSEHRLKEIQRLVLEHKIEVQRHRDLQAKCELDVTACTKKVEQMEEQLETAKKSSEECEKAIEEAKAEEEAAIEKKNEANEKMTAATEEAGTTREAVQRAITALQAAKEVESLKRHEHMEAQRQVGIVQIKLIAQEEETVKMELKLKEVEGLYKMQELEVERHRELSNRCKADLDTAKEREEEASQAALEAQRAVHKAEDELMNAESELEKALMKEREAQAASVMAQAEAEKARATVAGRVLALERAKERENLLETGLEEANALVKTAEARKTAQDAELDTCIKKLEELEKLCSEQEEEVAKQMARSKEVSEEMANAIVDEQKAGADLAAVHASVSVTQEELLRRQAEMALAQDKESNATTVKLAADGERAIQQSLVTAAEQQLMSLKEQEMLRKNAEEETLRAAELQSKLTRSIEAEQIELAARRLALETELSSPLSVRPVSVRP